MVVTPLSESGNPGSSPGSQASFVTFIQGSSKGRTGGFDPPNCGSIPCP